MKQVNYEKKQEVFETKQVLFNIKQVDFNTKRVKNTVNGENHILSFGMYALDGRQDLKNKLGW